MAIQYRDENLYLQIYPEGTSTTWIYLPIISKPAQILPQINIPYFPGQLVNYHEAAISWFGKVEENTNYTDVRIGFNTDEIYVRLSVIDRYRKYDPYPTIPDLTKWDSISLYLDLNGKSGNALNSNMYLFIGQEETKVNITNRQGAYQGSSAGWNLLPSDKFKFYTNSGYLAGGYVLTFHIPFSSFGLSSPPSAGTSWGMALTLHDRDDEAGNLLWDQKWPVGFDPSRSSTWSQLTFGLTAHSRPSGSVNQTVTIQNGLNGVNVFDGVVGGNTTCGDGLEYWNEWGNYSYPGVYEMNVQNEGRIDDWPCFSKFYITFPLDSLPPGKTVISANLILHQSGQSTGFDYDPPEALNSLVQVLEVNQDWDESTLSWNNGPLPIENVSQAWVGPITMADWGKAYSWDVSRALAKAYAIGIPLRLAVYSADTYGPHGKYFQTSNAAEFVRPSLVIELGDPLR